MYTDTYIKISNGQTMTECEFWEYLKTAKGYCCEKGWQWQNERTGVIKTGRQWKVYFETNIPYMCMPFITYKTTGANKNSFWIGTTEISEQLTLYIDWGDSTNNAYGPLQDIYAEHLYDTPGDYTVIIYCDNPLMVDGVDFSNFDTPSNNIYEFTFNIIPIHVFDADGTTNMQFNDLPTEYIDYFLCLFAQYNAENCILYLDRQSPLSPPSPEGEDCKSILLSNGCDVTTDL